MFTSTYYNSISLTFVGMLFASLMMILYFKKRNLESLSNKVFFATIVIVFFIGVLELLIPYTMSIRADYELINMILCKLYVSLIFVWQGLLLVYMMLLVKGSAESKSVKLKTSTIVAIFSVITLAVLYLFIFGNIEYSGGVNGMPYVAGGPILLFIYAMTFIGSFSLIAILIINGNIIKNVNLKPLFLTLSLYITSTAIQVLYNYEINDLVFFGSLISAVIYLTIESQDFKLLNEYKESKKAAETANKAKTTFLINMSHEIRTPLNTIIGFSQAIMEDEEVEKKSFDNDLKNISDAVSNLSGLIDSILDISKIENKEQVLNNSDYVLENLVFEINSFVPSKIANDDLKFSIDINETIPKEYNGDAYKIFKIITYVLLNAIDCTNYGEVKLTIDGVKTEDDYFDFNFNVSNTGHVMKNDEFSATFDDFLNLQNKSNLNSNRLGIIIAKELVKVMGGSIEFENKKGQGTKYFIHLKQKIINGLSIGNIFESTLNGISSSKNILNLEGKTALIVDDGEVNLAMAKKTMEPYNMKIITVMSGKECIDLVKKTKIDIIFLDHMMPNMDGITTVKLLNTSGYKIPPVIALTANSYDSLKNEYVAQGFTDYLQKPLAFKELNRVMKKIFGVEKQ